MEIKVDLHTHTLVSHHAYSTVKENAESAANIKMEAIAITDHAPAIPDGAHIWHFVCLKLIDPVVYGVSILKGAECSFLNIEGEVDLPEKVLKDLDVVIGSVHTPVYAPKTREEHTKLLLNAMENPYPHIFGHIDKVSWGADFALVAKTAVEKGKIIELNEHSIETPDNYQRALELMKACKKYKTKIVVNSDAHFCDRIGKFPHSEKLLKEINFDQDLILNTSLEKFLGYMKNQKI